MALEVFLFPERPKTPEFMKCRKKENQPSASVAQVLVKDIAYWIRGYFLLLLHNFPKALVAQEIAGFFDFESKSLNLNKSTSYLININSILYG